MKAGAKQPALLRDQPQPPPEFDHLIAVLGQFPAPLAWAQLESWARMRQRSFSRWELRVLAHADRQRQQ